MSNSSESRLTNGLKEMEERFSGFEDKIKEIAHSKKLLNQKRNSGAKHPEKLGHYENINL